MIELLKGEIAYEQPLLYIEKLRIRSGIITAITGESGAGKTSILNVLAGKLKFSGQYCFHHIKVEKINNYYDHISYLKQESLFLENMTCVDQLKMVLDIYQNKRSAAEIFKAVHLSISDSVYPNQLSGGEQKKFSIALALAKDADIWLCDEITASLDKENSQNIISLLLSIAEKYNKYIIITCHDPYVYNQCQQIYHIDNKNLLVKKEASLQTQEKELKKVNKKIGFTLYQFLIKRSLKKTLFQKTVITLLIACSVAFSALSLYSANQYKRHFNELYNIMGKNQSYVYNDSIGVKNYSTESIGFVNDEAYEALQDNAGIDKIYSFDSFKMDRYIVDIDSFINGEKEVELYYSEQGIPQYMSTQDSMKKITIEQPNETSSVSREYFDNPQVQITSFVYPYFEEQHLELKSKQFIDQEGAYITQAFANSIGITQLQPNTFISCDVAVPVGTLTAEINGITDSGSERKFLEETCVFKIVTLRTPIKGILDEGYVQLTSNCQIYLEAGYFDQVKKTALNEIYFIDETQFTLSLEKDAAKPLIQAGFNTTFSNGPLMSYDLLHQKYQATMSTDFKSFEITMSLKSRTNNCYTIFTNDRFSFEETLDEIKGLNSNYGIENTTRNAMAMGETFQKNNTFINLLVCLIIIVILMLVTLYSVLNNRSRIKEFEFLEEAGYKKKDYLRYILLETAYMFLTVLVFSFAFTVFLFLIGLKMKLFIMGYGFVKQLIQLFMYGLVLSFVLTLWMNGATLITLRKEH